MKKFFRVIFILVLLLFTCRLCLVKDYDIENTHFLAPNNEEQKVIYPEKSVTKTINGIDFLQSQAPVGKFGGEIIISTIGEGPKTFNPCNSKDATSSAMAGVMYDGLVTTNPYTGEVEPLLAKSFSIDGNEYTIYLRKGVKWSDGKPVTAEDVMYTYQEIVFKGLGNTATRDGMIINGKLPKIEKLDDYTIKFTTPTNFAPFLRQLSYPIVPKHYFKPYSDKGESAFNAFLSSNTNPKEIIYNGAYGLKEYIPAQRVVFVKNKNYYKINKNDEQLPYLDKLIYLIVGDTNNEILKFEAKEIDALSLKGSNVARYKIQEPKADFKIYNLGADTGTLFFVINLNNRKNAQGKWNVEPYKQEWFRDKNFRKALDYLTDRKAMVQNIAYGVAEPLYTAESLNSIYLNKNIKPHQKDKKVALNYLGASGFYLKNGILYDKNNHRVEFNLYTNAGVLEREALGVMLKQDFEDVGMKVNFKPIEFNTLVNKLSSTNDWDMAIMGLTGSPLEPHDGKNVWVSNGPLHLFNQRPQNYTTDDRFGWEKELDEIFDKAAEELSFEKRKPYYDRYQEIISEEAPIIYLYSPIRITAIRKKFKNIFPSSLNGLVHNLEEIYIDNTGN